MLSMRLDDDDYLLDRNFSCFYLQLPNKSKSKVGDHSRG